MILVDGDDRELGYGRKAELHQGEGRLHRAFSVFLFDDRQRLLVHRRSEHKPLWPGYWTNSCCSHPRRGEVLQDSVLRRLREELSCRVACLEHVFRFEYHARFGETGSEHELCHVYLASLAPGCTVSAHELEIAELAWLDIGEVDRLMAEQSDQLTPWFRKEWALLQSTYRDAMAAFLQRAASASLSVA